MRVKGNRALWATTAYLCLATLFLAVIHAAEPTKQTSPTKSSEWDQETYIDANSILMFVTNSGSFAHQAVLTFGKPAGLYFPFTTTADILSATNDNTALFAAGPWFGAIDQATGDTLTVIAEYTDEYWPGPMIGGTFDPDGDTDATYRVYKLFADSLASNPCEDYAYYLEYAVPLGAPVDEFGEPAVLGTEIAWDQMLWAVYNDANGDVKDNGASGTDPLGLEIQQTVWACYEPSDDTLFPYFGPDPEVTHIGTSQITVDAWVVDSNAVTGDSYRVTFEDTIYVDTIVNYYYEPPETSFVQRYYAWHLDNVTTATRLLAWQHFNQLSPVVEGMVLLVIGHLSSFESFEVVANAGGLLDPPEPGALVIADFPVPREYDPDGYISDRQQATGYGQWAIHTADNGGTCGGGDRDHFTDFVQRVLRTDQNDRSNPVNLGMWDWEIRFTGTYSNPYTGGGYAIEWFNDDNVFWVPFELWRIGVNTPDDPSDDVRVVPFIIDDAGPCGEWPGNDVFDLESYGCILDETGHGDGEHSVSSGDDDPFTDWVYWYMPLDDSPGEAGYLANEAQMLGEYFDGSLLRGGVANSTPSSVSEIMARMVLVNWNGGVEPPFTQELPEMGTVFRINTIGGSAPPDTFTFVSSKPLWTMTTSKGQEVYIRYLIYNKGDKTLTECHFALWADPDIGGSLDDLVGCDTLDNIFFGYNDVVPDPRYGSHPPATGFKYLCGPVVPSPGDNAYFNGRWIAEHKNLPMTAFAAYINGTDPQNYIWTWQYMHGLDAYRNGSPLANGSKFFFPGDPVTGVGDLDSYAWDKRMMGVCGPFDMAPGDSQFVLIRMAVGQGDDNLESVTAVREILNAPFDFPVGVSAGGPAQLPREFSVSQNYPNPFNPSTTIKYSLPERCEVRVEVYNVLGQRVRRLVDEAKPAGVHEVVWDGTSDAGQAVSTGVYFYKVKAGDYIESKKMLLVK